MGASRLLKLWKSFDERDWKNFNRYYSSQLRPKSDIYLFCAFIHNHRNKIGRQHIDVTRLTERHFNWDRKKMSNISARTKELVYEFLAHDALSSSPADYDFFKFKGLNDRGLYEEADRIASKIHHYFNRPGYYDIRKNLYRQRLLHEHYFSDNPIKYHNGTRLFRELITSMHEMQNEFALYYDIEIQNMEGILGGEWPDLRNLRNESQVHLSQQYQMLDQLYNLVYHDSETDFMKLHELLLSGNAKIVGELKAVLLIYLNRYALRKIGEGHEHLKSLLFSQYEYGLRSGIFLSKGHITTQRFLNMIQLGTVFNQISWARNFVESFSGLLEEPDRKDAKAVAAANILFAENKILQVLEILSTVNPTNIYLKVESRTQLLVAQLTYYENSPDLMWTSLRNYDDFIRRNQRNMSDRMVQSCQSLSNFLKRLNRHDDPQVILHDLKDYSIVAKKTWLSSYLQNKIDAGS